jgi:DNA-binding response OmpR family regulator
MSEKISVLVVDDEEHIRNILEYNLGLHGFKVYQAEDGPTGLELAREKKPGMILLDWMLPGMEGLQVLEKLKADQRTRSIPVIMITVKRMVNDVGNALLRGADDYIIKPFDPEELSKMLRRKFGSMVKN